MRVMEAIPSEQEGGITESIIVIMKVRDSCQYLCNYPPLTTDDKLGVEVGLKLG